MIRKTLDPNLASILDSIRATVGGEVAPAAVEPAAVEPAAVGPATVEDEPEPEAEAIEEAVRQPAPAPRARKAAAAPVPAAQRSVEDFLAELIRPQVESWLNAHLPELIQKMAAEEIARLTGRK